ncbi:zinc finger protein Elbow [Monomorium pharaonis]|uniref:zinc finger protein Elbow n=1 Tax=Monomorium pharaonis TaxID=307658 RepID=UPI001746E2EC|nr:zinc finger protein Elbow [Monomorium pharaonis]
MLTSSANQYLRPDHYLTPLPTTLDAKKSPLALLAQTCSQIGADPPSNKSLLSSLDKTSSNRSSKTAEQSSRDKSSPAVTTSATVPTSASESTKTSFKPYESCLGREKTCTPTDESRSTSSHSTSGRSRTPGNSSSSKRCPSNQSAASTRAVTPQGRKTATPNGEVARDSPVSRSSAPSSTVDVLSTSQPTVSSPSLQVKPAYSPVSVLAMADPSIKDLPLGTFKPGQVSLPASTAAYLGYSPSQLPIDVMANSLMSHHAALKNGINPYLYARLKSTGGPTAADGLMPICRDPFCTGCQLNSHLLSSPATAAAAAAAAAVANIANGKLPSGASGATPGSCPAGCAQCDHKPGSVSPYGSLGAVYAHAQLAALAAGTQLPYVCNWIAGDTAYCGKRFTTSEELLQHLRSHTNVSASGATAATDPTALSLLPGPPPGLHPATHPLFARSYPTPPLSPLATARYHPYGKPSPLLTPSLSTLGLPLPPPPPPPPHPHATAGLAYFSPYSIYGSRLGATSGMHQ